MIKLYNSLGQAKEEFRSIEPHQVGIYVCGPTVYEYDHLGHARTYLSFDLLIRFLEFSGYRVNYIQNITDVGHLVGDGEVGLDKVQRKARDEGIEAQEVIERYTNAHTTDLQSLNIRLPNKLPRASQHIEHIIKFIEGLISKGIAYATSGGNVYFQVSRDPDYGKLSHRRLAEIITGTRIEPANDKRSPADFALWKGAPHGAVEMVWESPWGKGTPGWHIECSAMSREYLGDTFDIHGSAIEHIFPHHENEIAQSESLTGKQMANWWIHAGMLSINGQKMSRSVPATMIKIKDELTRHSSNELRLAFYLTHYRRPFDYTAETVEQGVALRKKLFTAYATNKAQQTDPEVWQKIMTALEDDLDSPTALAVWAQDLDKINKEDTNKLFQIFGLKFSDIKQDDKAMKLAEERQEARRTEDFLTADNRKAELALLGYEVLDLPDGTTYLPR